MMKAVKLCLALWMAAASLSAGLAWPQPVVAASYANLEFNGSAATASNGNTLISWAENIGENYCLCLCLYDQQNQPQWPEPITIELPLTLRSMIVATPAGDFIFTIRRDDGLYAYKVSQSGMHLWGQNGVRLFAYNSSFMEITQDSSGGAWFSRYHEQDGYSVVQHVDTAGNRLLPVQGLMLEPANVTTLIPVLYGLPDDGVIIAYRTAANLKIKRLSNVGAPVWIESPVVTGVCRNQRICGFTDSTFALSWWNEDGLWMQHYSFDAIAQWDSPVSVFSGGSTPWDNKTKLLQASDSCVFITGEILYQPLRLQKVSSDGQLLFGSGTELLNNSYHLVADNGGGCYAGTAYSDIRLARISSTGEQLWGISGIPVCEDSNDIGGVNLSFYEGTISTLWMDWKEGYSGLNVQKFLPSGVSLLPENGLSIRRSLYAQIKYPRVCAAQDKSVLLWVQRSQPSGRFRLMMQIVLPDGSCQLQSGGIALTDYCISDNYPVPPILKVTPSGEIMVSWYDDLSSQCKAQLYSSSAAPLWGNEAITVNGMARTSLPSYLDGSFIFVNSKQNPAGANRIYGQKITSGLNMWPSEGLLLVADDPDDPAFSIGNLGMSGNYLIWDRGQIWCLAFNSDGGPALGFDPWGKQLSQTEMPYRLGPFSCDLVGENLYCNWYESYLVHPSFGYWSYRYNQQVISPEGQLLIVPGLVYEEEGDAYAISNYHVEAGVGDDCFITGYQTNLGYQLRRHSLSGSLLSDTHCNLSSAFKQAYYIAGLENSRIFLLVDYHSTEMNLIAYVTVDPGQQVATPIVTAIFERPFGEIKGIDFSQSDEEFLVATAMSCSRLGTQGNASRIFLQKIVDPGSANPDFESVPIAPFTLSTAMPNPFRGAMTFECSAKQNIYVELDVYNLRGQKVRSIFKGLMPQGTTRFDWDGKDYSSRSVSGGIYILRAKADGHTQLSKILKLD